MNGRNPCSYGDKCLRDHNFKKPISSRVKDAAKAILNKTAKYGKDATEYRKKFKVDMLKAMG